MDVQMMSVNMFRVYDTRDDGNNRKACEAAGGILLAGAVSNNKKTLAALSYSPQLMGGAKN